MQKKTIATLFLLIFLVSCASPALQITATSIAQPTRTTAVTQTPSPTETTIPTITDSAPAILPEPIKEFTLCSTIEDFQNCKLEESEVSDWARYVQSTLTPELFDTAKLNFVDVYTRRSFGNLFSYLVPNSATAPNYEVPGSAPFIKEFASAMPVVDGEKRIALAVPHYVPGVDPQDWPVMIGLENYEAIDAVTKAFHDMNVIAWDVSPESLALATRFVNPATGVNWTEAEVLSVIQQIEQHADFSGANGLVLKMQFLVDRDDVGMFK